MIFEEARRVTHWPRNSQSILKQVVRNSVEAKEARDESKYTSGFHKCCACCFVPVSQRKI